MKYKEEIQSSTRTLFVCQCGDIHHQMVITFDDDPLFNDALFFEIHLSDTGFWKRLKYGILYILGRKSRFGYGAFSEVMLSKNETQRLIDILKSHSLKMKVNE